MTDNIVTILRDWGTRDLKSRIVQTLLRDAADEIERLSDENIALRKAVGEEGRANRMTLLYESAQNEIERLQTQVDESTAALSRAVTALMCKVDDINRLRSLGDEIVRWHSDLGPWANEFKSAVRAWQKASRG